MTATNFNGVYLVGKRKTDADKNKLANAKRVAVAIKRNSKFRKK